MNLRHHLDAIVSNAMTAAGCDADTPAVIKQAARPEFGHYQANGVMGAAKKLGMNPRELATKVVANLESAAEPIIKRLEIAGPGFINIHLNEGSLSSQLEDLSSDAKLGTGVTEQLTFVIDYSSPNLAKEMHIGHLRPTAIGDAIVRILEFQSHRVHRANHVGDWGAQFGSLLAYLDDLQAQGQNTAQAELKDLEKFYQAASSLFRDDEAFANRARNYVVRLQNGDPHCLKLWQQFIDESISHCQAVYEEMNVSLTEADIVPESFYNDSLHPLIEELTQLGLLVESDGAKCVFLEEFTGKEGKPLPAIIQKSDGGCPYMATDVAAVKYRSQTLKVDGAYYFVGAEQQLHLRQVFAVATAAGYISAEQVFSHFPSGSINGPDGRRFKTREGNNVKLADVIKEAKDRALLLVEQKNPELEQEVKQDIARVVGIGAVKYAELSKNRMTDYIFDWDAMLSFDGNTAPYLQYAYTRIRSIFRKQDIESTSLTGTVSLDHAAELALAVKLLQFPEAVNAVLDDCQPNLLCNYLFELAGVFMHFYEACPVLGADPATRDSRLRICHTTATVLKQGLNLLGIETVEQM